MNYHYLDLTNEFQSQYLYHTKSSYLGYILRKYLYCSKYFVLLNLSK